MKCHQVNRQAACSITGHLHLVIRKIELCQIHSCLPVCMWTNEYFECSCKYRPFIGGQDSPWTMLSVMLQCNYSLLNPCLVLSLRKQLKCVRNNWEHRESIIRNNLPRSRSCANVGVCTHWSEIKLLTQRANNLIVADAVMYTLYIVT